jgi:PAS domain S-box-containing protein
MPSEGLESLNGLLLDVNFLKKVLDISSEGLYIVDKNGIIVYADESFERIHHLKQEECVGKHVTEVMENTRMHIVAKTGVAENDHVQMINGHEFVVSRIPIIINDHCVGAVGKIRFHDVDEVKRLTNRVNKLEKQLKNEKSKRNEAKHNFEDIVAFAEETIRAKNTAMRAATSDATVLLMGESGVGKEVFAHSIHNLSPRSNGPFIRLNCSAIQESLIESELFGYEEGAFTGAKKGGKKGKFELANNGTILLDEIGDMPMDAQAKLLRVIQEQEFDKVGGEGVVNVDVRIIAATNQDLWQLVEEGKFRRDLFYRLNVIPIFIPALRERKLDIPELVRLFWEELKKNHGIYHKNLDQSAVAALKEHHWPGNIRELRNVLERAITVVLQNTITANHIQTIIKGHEAKSSNYCIANNCTLQDLIENTEKNAISIALLRANNNKSRASKLLGISRALLYKKMHYYDIFA